MIDRLCGKIYEMRGKIIFNRSIILKFEDILIEILVIYDRGYEQSKEEETGQENKINISSVCGDEEAYIETNRCHLQYSEPRKDTENSILLLDDQSYDVGNYFEETSRVINGVYILDDSNEGEKRIDQGSEGTIHLLLQLSGEKTLQNNEQQIAGKTTDDEKQILKSKCLISDEGNPLKVIKKFLLHLIRFVLANIVIRILPMLR